MSSADRETWENDLTGAYEWLASVPTWVIVLAMIFGIIAAALRTMLPSWGRRAAGIILLVALVGCELPTANPEQGPPEQAQVFGARGVCVQYFVPPRYYDRVPDSSYSCSLGDRPEVIGIAYTPAPKRTCAETYMIPPAAKQVYGCVKRPPITETPL